MSMSENLSLALDEQRKMPNALFKEPVKSNLKGVYTDSLSQCVILYLYQSLCCSTISVTRKKILNCFQCIKRTVIHGTCSVATKLHGDIMLLTFKLVKNTIKFIMCSMGILFIYYYQNYSIKHPRHRLVNKIRTITTTDTKYLPDIKYILIWTRDEKFNFLRKGQKAFISHKCKFTNCFVSTHRNMIYNDYRNFDAILFSGKKIAKHFFEGYLGLPKKRANGQLYIFGMQEDAVTYPVCSDKFDDYFNLTWTYRLDSDIIWSYFRVLELESGKVIGPGINIEWGQTDAVKNDTIVEIQEKLMEKEQYGAWVSSDCHTQSKREDIIKIIKEESQKSGNVLDLVGDCGSKECEVNLTQTDCMNILESYNFYMAFESTNDTDYVTTEVVSAIDHFCLPVVYGGANYSRFLPPHSYIDATVLGATEVAKLMEHLTDNMADYYNYFNWRSFFKIVRETGRAACDLCESLNNRHEGVHTNFREWWNPNFKKACKTEHKRTGARSKQFWRDRIRG